MYVCNSREEEEEQRNSSLLSSLPWNRKFRALSEMMMMMSRGGGLSITLPINFIINLLFIFILLQAYGAASFVVPSSNCYAIDNISHIFDFTRWIGHQFEYVGKDGDIVVRFCKDVESRSQAGYGVFPAEEVIVVTKTILHDLGANSTIVSDGYLDFGRFYTFNDHEADSGTANFVQEFYNGDLTNCEQTFDKLGRTAQVNIICGSCLSGACKGDLGCICSVSYDSSCRVVVELAIPCEKHGPRVFKGFTVGFNPRSWEVVYNGMTQLGFEKLHHEFSFGTEQTHVSLYMTAISAVSGLVGKPIAKVNPSIGLEVKLSGSGANGIPPTTLSPSMLIVDWRCEKAHDTPYEIAISIPVEGYEPIEFTLTKMCENRQDRKEDATRGWATFGILSCIFIVVSTLGCCGGFIYKARVEHQHGLDAVPGMTILSACLEAVSGGGGGGGGGGYSRAEDSDSTFVNQASWERQPVSAQGTQRTAERKYGSI